MMKRVLWVLAGVVVLGIGIRVGMVELERIRYERMKRELQGYVVDLRVLPETQIPVPKPRVFVAKPPVGVFTAKHYPRVDGSTSTQPLRMLFVCRLLGSACAWEGSGETRLLAVGKWEDQESLVLADHIESVSPTSGTHGAYVHLLKREADLVLVAREPSADELALAKEKAIELDVRTIARDAFVFVVNEANSVTNLSTEHIRDIYAGKTQRWDEVGGPRWEMKAYQRNPNSGSQELMKRLVMKERPFNPPIAVVASMSEVFNKTRSEKASLAYSVFFYQQRMAPSSGSRLIAVDGVMPSVETIAAGKYPYATKVHVVIRKSAKPSGPVRRLRDWMLSPQGQAIVAEVGYVPGA